MLVKFTSLSIIFTWQDNHGKSVTSIGWVSVMYVKVGLVQSTEINRHDESGLDEYAFETGKGQTAFAPSEL